MRRALIKSSKYVIIAALLPISSLLICLIVLPDCRPLARCQQVPSSTPDRTIEIRIGFLVARQQRGLSGGPKNNAQAGRTYSSLPGQSWLMSHVFNYALAKLNSDFNLAGAESAPPSRHATATRESSAVSMDARTPAGPSVAPAPEVTRRGQRGREPASEVEPGRPLPAQARDGRRPADAQERAKSNSTFLDVTDQVGSDVDGGRVAAAAAAAAAAARSEAPDNHSDAAGQEPAHRRAATRGIIFKPLVAETYANEAESIKQTIDLITRQKAHVILGPQGRTCQVEPIIASIYNVPMLSHYCSHDQITTTISSRATGSGLISGAQSTPKSNDHRQLNEPLVASSVVDQHQPHKIPLHRIVSAVGASHQQANTFIQSKPPVWKIVKRVISLLRNLIDRNPDRAYELVLLYYKERPPPAAVKPGRTSTLAEVREAGAAVEPQASSPADVWKTRDANQSLLLTSNQGRVTPSHSPATGERPPETPTLGQGSVGADDEEDEEEHEEAEGAERVVWPRSSEADRFKIISHLLEIKLSRLVGGVPRQRAADSSSPRAAKNSTSSSYTKEQSAGRAGPSLRSQPPVAAYSLAVLNWHSIYNYARNPFRQLLRRHLVQRQRLEQQRRSTLYNGTASNDQRSERCQTAQGGAISAQSPPASIYIVVGHYYEHLGLILALDEFGLLESDHDDDDEAKQTSANGVDWQLDDDDDEERRQTKRPSAPHSPPPDAAANRRGQWSRNNEGARRRRERQPAIVIGVDIEPYDESYDSVRYLRGLLLDGAQPTPNPSAAGATAGASDTLNESPANSLASRYNSYLAVMPAKPSKSIELLDEMRRFYNKTQASGAGDEQRQDLKVTQTILQLKQQAESKNGSLFSIYDSNLLALKMLQFARLPVEAYYLYDSMMLLGAYYAECLANLDSLSHCSEGRRMFAWFAGRSYSSYADQLGSRFDAQARSEGSYSLLARRLPSAAPAANTRHNQSLTEDLLEVLADDEFDIGPVARFTSPRDALQFQVGPASIARLWWPLWCAGAEHSSASINSTIDCSIYHSSAHDALTDCANQSSTLNEDANGGLKWSLFGASLPMQTDRLSVAFVAAASLICFALICVCLLSRIVLERDQRAEAGAGVSLSLNQLLLGCHSVAEPDNSSWFGARDVRNFLQIVHELILMPDDSLINEAHERDEVGEWLAAGEKLAQLAASVDPNERLTGSARNQSGAGAGANRERNWQQQEQNPLEEDKPSGSLSCLETYCSSEEAALKQNSAPPFHLDRSLAQAEGQAGERDPLGCVAVDLHCYMFAFPSCKFVHWLMAILKLKELLFKYQSNLNSATGDIEHDGASGGGAAPPTSVEPRRRGATLLQKCAGDKLMFQLPILLRDTEPIKAGRRQGRLRKEQRIGSSSNNNNGAAGNSCATFFTARHRHTGMLRLLLNKYKETNERLCRLSQLEHPNLVHLLGVTLANNGVCGPGEKVARLLLERVERGNLRHELRKLAANEQLGARAAAAFRCALWRPLLADLICGLEFLHERAEIGFHGQLNALNCLLTADWRLKLAGFHVTHMRRSLGQYRMRLPPEHEGPERSLESSRSTAFVSWRRAASIKPDCFQLDQDQDELDASVYMAPELLSNCGENVLEGGRVASTTLGAHEMRLADIYAFAFVAFELFTSREPWSCRDDGGDKDGFQLVKGSRHRLRRRRAELLVAERVKVDSSFRPPIGKLDKILPILRHQSHQRAPFSAASCRQLVGGEHEEDEDDCLAHDNLLLGASFNTFSLAAAKTQISQPAASRKVHCDGDKFKRLLEACWSRDSGARPQSVQVLRTMLRQAGFVTRATSESGSPAGSLTQQPSGVRLQQPGRLLKLYTKLLERASSARKQKLLLECQASARLRLALLPVASFAPTQQAGSATASFGQHHERVFVCLFRFLSLTNVTNAGWPQVEALNGLLAQLDERVDSYRGHLHLWDSQVDSMMRFMVCASEPSSLAGSSEGRHGIVAQSCSPETPYNRISLLTTFAFELIDMANEWQSKFEGQMQVRCALHLGQANGFCLMMPPDRARQRAGQLPSVLKLSRYVMSGSAIEGAKILEQSGQPQRIHISADYKAALLQEHEQQACLNSMSRARHEMDLKSLLPSILVGADANLVPGQQQEQQPQCYVIILRSNKIQAKGFDQETHWLLNGPRVTASQRLMLPLVDGKVPG